MTNSTTNENIITLLNTWDELIRKPTELVFAKSLYHDLQILSDIVTESIASGNNLRRWQKDLIAELHIFLTVPNYESSFIQSYYPSLYTQLVSASTPDASGNYDKNTLDQAIRNLIRAIQAPGYFTDLHNKLVSSFASISSDAKDKIEALTQLLLVRLVEIVSPQTLEKYAPTAISKSFLELHQTELKSAFQKIQVQQSLAQLIEALSSSLGLFVQVISSVTDVPTEERAKNLSNYMLSSDREFSARVNLFLIQKLFEGVTLPQDIIEGLFEVSTNNHHEQAKFIAKSVQLDFWTNLVDRWFDSFSKLAIHYFFVRILAESSAPQASIRSTKQDWFEEYVQQIPNLHALWESYCTISAEELFSTGLFQDWEHQTPDWLKNIPVYRETSSGLIQDADLWGSLQRHSAKQELKRVVGSILAFGLGMALGTTGSINLDSSKTDQLKHQLIEVILEEILQHLVNANQRGELDPSGLKQADIIKVLSRFQTQRRIIEVLVGWFQSFCELFLSSLYLFSSSKTAAFLTVRDTQAIIDVFNKHLFETVTKSFKGPEINFVINQIQDSEVNQILADLILVFTHPPYEYRVIGIIDGLDLKGENLMMGKVRLYDARIWDYGEANLLDGLDLFAYRGHVERYAPAAQTPLIQFLSSNYEYKGRYGIISDQLVRHSARAATTVQTHDPKMAQELASIEFNQTLDILTWCYTGKKKDDISSKFELLPYYVVINTSEQSINQLTGRDSPLLTCLDAREEKLARFTQFYDPLLSQPESARTEVEQAIIRAFHWLAKGYWETYKVDQFLNYWIALEQLLVQTGEGKLDGVRKRLPGLVSTWDRTELGQQLLTSCRELTEEIQTHSDIQTQLDANPSITDWQTNRLILLQNLALLEQIDTSQKLTQLPRLKVIFDPSKISAAKNELQEKTRYQIGLLNRRRNLIIHEGYSYSPDMTHYTDAIWSFARFACARVTDRICANVGKYQTIDDVIATYDIPW